MRARGKWGFLNPETPLFQEMGIRGPVWGRGKCNSTLVRDSALFPARGSAEHFIEDQPQVPHLGMQHLLPEGSDMKDRERLVRRLEMCAKARGAPQQTGLQKQIVSPCQPKPPKLTEGQIQPLNLGGEPQKTGVWTLRP